MTALRRELDEALAAIGNPPRLSMPAESPEQLEQNFDSDLRRYRRELMRWRSAVLDALPRLEGGLKQAAEIAGDAGVKQMMDEYVSQVALVLEAEIARAEAAMTVPPDTKARLDFAAAVDPELAKIVQSVIRKYFRIVQGYCESLYDIRDRLKVLEWDYDPDARGGQSFDNADDLLASL